jgi:hypothetical protein
LDLESDTRDVQIWLQINKFGGFMDAFKNWDGYKLLTMSLEVEKELMNALGGGYKAVQLFITVHEC